MKAAAYSIASLCEKGREKKKGKGKVEAGDLG